MNSLIQITKNKINGAEINSVNAREIHEHLKVKTKFADWIKRAIEKYDFIENQDFIVLKNGNGTNAFIDYIVTLDMGKELAMLENNPKGKEIRKEFIQIEKDSLNIINNQSVQIEILKETLNQLSIMDNRVTTLESTRRLENWQELALQDSKNKKVYSIAEKHDLMNDKEMIRKLHSRVWKCLKKRFNIPRYNELPSLKFNDGINFINNLSLSDLL